MTQGVRPGEWLEDLARVAGDAPTEDEPGRYVTQLDGIAAKLEQQRAQRRGWFVAGGIAATAGIALAWSHADARTELVELDTRFEAPAWAGTERASGHAEPKRPEPEPPRKSNRAIVHDEPPRQPEAKPEPVHRPKPTPSVSARDLLARAQQARADRRAEDARAALTEIRSRFPNSEAAEQATFLLGRVEHELAGDARAAREWFTRYVAEYPEGRFAGSARGRILRELDAHGDRGDATAAARAYVQHHPDGPYRDLADRVLAGP